MTIFCQAVELFHGQTGVLDGRRFLHADIAPVPRGIADAGNAFLAMFACVVGPFIGAVLAAFCWMFFFGKKETKAAE